MEQLKLERQAWHTKTTPPILRVSCAGGLSALLEPGSPYDRVVVTYVRLCHWRVILWKRGRRVPVYLFVWFPPNLIVEQTELVCDPVPFNSWFVVGSCTCVTVIEVSVYWRRSCLEHSLLPGHCLSGFQDFGVFNILGTVFIGLTTFWSSYVFKIFSVTTFWSLYVFRISVY